MLTFLRIQEARPGEKLKTFWNRRCNKDSSELTSFVIFSDWLITSFVILSVKCGHFALLRRTRCESPKHTTKITTKYRSPQNCVGLGGAIRNEQSGRGPEPAELGQSSIGNNIWPHGVEKWNCEKTETPPGPQQQF